MARQGRELRTRMTVGDYSFEMKITRDILQQSLSKCKGIWEYIKGQESAQEKSVEDISLDDMFASFEFMDNLDEFITDVLPKMIAAAEEGHDKEFDGTVDEFLDYCNDGGVLQEVETRIFEFAMLGFTGGRGNDKTEKPKLKVVMG